MRCRVGWGGEGSPPVRGCRCADARSRTGVERNRTPTGIPGHPGPSPAPFCGTGTGIFFHAETRIGLRWPCSPQSATAAPPASLSSPPSSACARQPRPPPARRGAGRSTRQCAGTACLAGALRALRPGCAAPFLSRAFFFSMQFPTHTAWQCTHTADRGRRCV